MKAFCIDKNEIEEIKSQYDDFGRPNICYIVQKNKDYCLLVYLDPVDYYPYYCKQTLIKNILYLDDNESHYYSKLLNPNVFEINKYYIKISLKNKIYKVEVK